MLMMTTTDYNSLDQTCLSYFSEMTKPNFQMVLGEASVGSPAISGPMSTLPATRCGGNSEILIFEEQ